APIESNSTYFADNPLVKKHRSKLGFRMNFSFMHLYQLAQDTRNPQNLARQSVVWEGGKEGVGEKKKEVEMVKEAGKISPGISETRPEEEPKIIHYYSLSELVAGRKEKLIAWQKQKS
ncbi:5409_t:CDS:2, partial [Entrophospora sp. SA101]